MSTASTSSLTERSPVRSASTRRRRVGSPRISNTSAMATYYWCDICLVNNAIGLRAVVQPDKDAALIVTLVLVRSDGTAIGSLPPFSVTRPHWPEVEEAVARCRAIHGVEVTILRLLSAEPARPGGW